MKRVLASLAALSLFTLVASGDDNADKKPFDDATFVAKAASGNLHEVELGQLALKQAKRQDVKDFAQKLITDHTAANVALKTAAASANYTIPEKMNDEHQKMYDKFKNLQNEEFDNAFIKHMVKDHEMDIKEFMRASKEAKQSSLRDFATKTLPTLEEHLELVKKIRDTK